MQQQSGGRPRPRELFLYSVALSFCEVKKESQCLLSLYVSSSTVQATSVRFDVLRIALIVLSS